MSAADGLSNCPFILAPVASAASSSSTNYPPSAISHQTSNIEFAFIDRGQRRERLALLS